jgi:O-acetyl-ADP-ribose deacetylase (regulator of RNase III)
MADNLVKRIGKTELYVVEGDITQIPADAMMTAINSGGMWFGGIDGAIQRVAGGMYHSQAADRMPLSDLQVVVAKGDRNLHRGQFNDVVFVVDDLRSPLSKVMYAGLEAAHNQGYDSLLIPAIRMGVMAGAVEKTQEETFAQISEGIDKYMRTYDGNSKLTNLTFVVYKDPSVTKQLRSGLGRLLPG